MKYTIPLYIISSLTCPVLYAEVTLDGTLGPRIAIEGPDYAIGARLGQQHSNNLFHSFENFNLNSNESATFSGPNNISNILSRVTGGSPSHINGLFRSTIPNADVYFFNPYGILFGKEAQLDVQGSFHASTADTLRFNDGNEFNARNPEKSLLTVAPVASFGFLTEKPQPLSIEESELTLSSGKTLSLFGGDIQINQAFLTVPSGRINIASVVNQGEVTSLPQDLILSTQAGEVTLQNSEVNVSNDDGNDRSAIYIRAGQFFMENSIVRADINSAIKSAEGGKINVRANELRVSHGGQFRSDNDGVGQGSKIKIKVAGLSEFFGETVDENGDVTNSGILIASRNGGDGGSLELETGTLNLKEGAFITAPADELGQGGNINLQATHSITLSGTDSLGYASGIGADTYGEMENAGNGGKIVLEAKQLHLRDGAIIQTNTFGAGQGGQISIKVADNVTLSGEGPDGTSSIATKTEGSGHGGILVLEANQLALYNGTTIITNSEGSGLGGNLQIEVSDLVKLEGVDSQGYSSVIAANANTENAGDGGTIVLITERLQLLDGAQIVASTFGSGQGGQLNIKAAKEAFFSGYNSQANTESGLFTASENEEPATASFNPGDGGKIELKVGDLHLTDNAQINAGTYGNGRGGNIDIQAHTLKLTEGGTITALSEGQGDAGKVALTIGDKLQMHNSYVETKAESADGGNLVITATNYLDLIDSKITTSVNEDFGGGGNITLKPEFVVLDGATIFAKAKKGKGGNIDITTTGVYNFTDEPIAKIINASSELGVDGVVTISTPDNNAQEDFIVLPATFFDASTLLDTPCDQRLAENTSKFTIVQSEGIANALNDLFSSGPLLSEPVDHAETQTVKKREQGYFSKIAFMKNCSKTYK